VLLDGPQGWGHLPFKDVAQEHGHGGESGPEEGLDVAPAVHQGPELAGDGGEVDHGRSGGFGMGAERVVTFSGSEPSWPAVRDRITAAGGTVQMRMIDNQPAFPDEDPEEGWRELRLNLGAGMLTLRREPGRMRVVAWGNADEALRRDQEALAKACAAASGGTIV
jgi:hypothetical protein